MANKDRNPKKQKKPYTYLDFSFYQQKDDGDKPQGHHGSAYMAVLRAGLMPSWALFCYKELAQSANPGYVPEVAAFISEDAILFHPEPSPAGYTGLLVAMESAGDKRRVFKSTDGSTFTLVVPYIETKLVAIEGATLNR